MLVSSLVNTAVSLEVARTVSVAVVVVAVPAELENTARYRLPLLAPVVGGVVYVPEVAPLRFDQELPELVLTCHCTLGVGVPDAAAVKVAVLPALTVALVG